MLPHHYSIDVVFNAGDLSCGDLVLELFKKMKALSKGQIIEVISYDLGAVEDVPAWCRMQGHLILDTVEEGVLLTHFYIQKIK